MYDYDKYPQHMRIILSFMCIQYTSLKETFCCKSDYITK